MLAGPNGHWELPCPPPLPFTVRVIAADGKFLITLHYACPSSHKATLLADILSAASSARDATAVLALPSPTTHWVKANNDLTPQCVVCCLLITAVRCY